MNNETLVQVLTILVQAAEAGQKAGAFDLASAGVISQAVVLAKQEIEAGQAQPQIEPQVEEETKKKK